MNSGLVLVIFIDFFLGFIADPYLKVLWKKPEMASLVVYIAKKDCKEFLTELGQLYFEVKDGKPV